MPIVQEYNPPGASVSQRSTPLQGAPGAVPLNNAFRTPDPVASFGVAPLTPTASGEAVASFGNNLLQVSESIRRFQLRRDTVEAEEVSIEFEREKNRLLFEGENGYFNRQGRNAFDTAEEATTQIRDLANKYSESLTSPQAREMFQRFAESHVTASQRDISRHASNQFTAWESATIQARVETSISNAGLYWKDPDALALELEAGREALLDLMLTRGTAYDEDGKESDVYARQMQVFNSSFGKTVVEAALSESASAAQKVLGDYRDLFVGTDVADLQQKIDRKMQAEIVQSNSAAAVKMASSLVAQFGDEPNARSLITAEIDKIEDADLLDRTLRESMYRLDLKMRADSERRAASFESAEQFILQGQSVTEWVAQNPQAWQDLTADQKKQLEKGYAPTTDFTLLSELLLLPKVELAAVNPAEYFHKLAPADRMRLISAVESARTGKIESGPESQLGRTIAAQTKAVVDRLFGEDPNKKQKQQIDEFYAAITEEQLSREAILGRRMTSEEYTALLNDFSRSVTIERRWMFDSQQNITNIDPGDLTELSRALRSRGIPVTADNILKLYQQAK